MKKTLAILACAGLLLPGLMRADGAAAADTGTAKAAGVPAKAIKAAKAKKAKKSAKPQAAAHWTCPMHPEVDLDHPGKCPKCGMDLVRKKV